MHCVTRIIFHVEAMCKIDVTITKTGATLVQTKDTTLQALQPEEAQTDQRNFPMEQDHRRPAQDANDLTFAAYNLTHIAAIFG